MNWLQLKLATTKDNLDLYSDLLQESGAVAISVEGDQNEAIFELNPEHKPLWHSIKIVALFPQEQDPISIQFELAQHIDQKSLKDATWKLVVEEDWLNKWKEDLRPMQFGDSLWVIPTWCEVPDPKAINIMLDPEQAFGTGSHPTTSLCLEWLAQNINKGDVVIDYGCGSGVLAIAAALLGALKTYGVDIDPLCLEVSQNNARNNKVEPQLFETYLPENMPNIQADVLVANILAQPLIGLAPTFARLMKPGAKLVLSGILAEQQGIILEAFTKWFGNFQIEQKAEWIRVTADMLH